MNRLLTTKPNDATLLFLRVSLGIILFPHGAQKLLGWFGGFGFDGTMSFFTITMELPWIIGFLVILIEFFGSLALLVGIATRLIATGVIAVMTGAILTSHLQFGFFMNWLGDQQGEGFEFHLLVIVIATALLIRGGGKWSLDNLLANQKTTISSKPRPIAS